MNYDVDALKQRSGLVPVPGGTIFWHMVGDGPGTPLLVLHGGPGSAHQYLLSMTALGDERPIIFYDQLGCGQSEQPADEALYTIPRSVQEVQAVRDALGLDRVILFGHSWGGMLAIEYLCQEAPPSGVERLILCGAHADMPQCSRGMQRLLQALPGGAGARLKELEAIGEEGSEEYEQIAARFYAAHLCRLDPWPQAVIDAMTTTAASIAYQVMNGPNEFTCVGVIRDWTRREDLHRIAIPTLIVSGEYDEVDLECQKTLQAGISGSELFLMPACSHLVMNEDPDSFLAALRRFMR